MHLSTIYLVTPPHIHMLQNKYTTKTLRADIVLEEQVICIYKYAVISLLLSCHPHTYMFRERIIEVHPINRTKSSELST